MAAAKKAAPLLASKAPPKSSKIKTEAGMKKALKAEKPVGDASAGVVSPVSKTPEAAPKARKSAKPRTPKA